VVILQVAFAGAIEFDKKRLFFFASCSRAASFSCRLMAAWAAPRLGRRRQVRVHDRRLHPRFNPPPLPFRVGATVDQNSRRDNAMVRVETYFAVTSNTVQIGASAKLRFGFSSFGIEGGFGFDALFQFSPFYFIIEVNVSLKLKVAGLDVLSVRWS